MTRDEEAEIRDMNKPDNFDDGDKYYSEMVIAWRARARVVAILLLVGWGFYTLMRNQ